jgi:L,D-peptidoglycan transpeptidase YkuD (ErfK/YbiS/YcfS/YnhG family)
MLFVNTASRLLTIENKIHVPCAVGKHGAIAEMDKREGDGKTPLGSYKLLKIFARPDRVAPFTTELPFEWLTPQHGWCDDASHQQYNKQVMLPFGPNHETLWREDGLYDVIVTLSHNDDPVMPHLGSAIFLHCCKYDNSGAMKPTLGCVAIAKTELLALCAAFTPDTQIKIQ